MRDEAVRVLQAITTVIASRYPEHPPLPVVCASPLFACINPLAPAATVTRIGEGGSRGRKAHMGFSGRIRGLLLFSTATFPY